MTTPTKKIAVTPRAKVPVATSNVAKPTAIARTVTTKSSAAGATSTRNKPSYR